MFYTTETQVQNRTKLTYNVYDNNNKLCKKMDYCNIKIYYKPLTSLKGFLASYKYYNNNFLFFYYQISINYITCNIASIITDQVSQIK